MQEKSAQSNYVIFGASGDLSRRYILPSLENIKYTGEIIPVSRKDYDNLENLMSGDREHILHLSIPPVAVVGVIDTIGKLKNIDKVKILLEKPFGHDLESAKNLVKHLDKYFKEDQIYLIDHYLAKKSARNLALENWSKENVASIEIIASEQIDIQGRVHFYEAMGALRDFVQSHLFALAAIVLSGSLKHEERHTALKNLAVVCDPNSAKCVRRGQYEGYRAEVGNALSMTETFVSINMVSSDPSWRGVAITLTTGKALHEKLTQVKIKYKNNEEKIFSIDPEPDAYERVISAAISGTRDVFVSTHEVLETWRIVEGIQQAWKKSPDNLTIYKKGSDICDIMKI